METTAALLLTTQLLELVCPWVCTFVILFANNVVLIWPCFSTILLLFESTIYADRVQFVGCGVFI